MKHYDRHTDALMMPSTFRWNAKLALNEREKAIMGYAPLVMKVVNTFNRDDSRVGVFNKHDIIQSGFVGLVEGYDRIVRDEENKLNVNYLEINIKGTIDRYLNYQATGVAIPEYQLQKAKAEIVADRIFGAWMYSFRLEDISISGKVYADFSYMMENPDDYANEQLSQELSDLMWQLSSRERDVLNMSYGISVGKMSMVEMEKVLGIGRMQISRIKRGALKKLDTNKNRILFANYL